MAKKIRIVLTLQLPAGKATPAPPVGTALGPHGINIVEFTKSYNEKTADKAGQIIPAQITIFEDRSFTFILKTPPAADLLRKAAGIEKGSRHRQARDRRPGHQRPGPRDRRRSRWPTSTPTTSTPPTRRSRAPPVAWASRSSASHRRRDRPRRATAGTRTARSEGEAGTAGRQEGTSTWHTARSTSRRRSSSTGDRLRARSRRPSSSRRPPRSTFDATVEAHLRLGVDPRHADQMVRGTVVLPARHRQGRPRRRVRPGREGPGGAARRGRRGRRRGPRQEDRGRLARVRRRPRDARLDGPWSASSARSSAGAA